MSDNVIQFPRKVEPGETVTFIMGGIESDPITVPRGSMAHRWLEECARKNEVKDE